MGNNARMMRTPFTVEEVHNLLTATMHGSLPDATVSRMMATLAEWSSIISNLDLDSRSSDSSPTEARPHRLKVKLFEYDRDGYPVGLPPDRYEDWLSTRPLIDIGKTGEVLDFKEQKGNVVAVVMVDDGTIRACILPEIKVIR